MTSSTDREPLTGIIHQQERVVGAICLPEENLLDFINEFNHCYGPLHLHIEPPRQVQDKTVYPVGARRPLHPDSLGTE